MSGCAVCGGQATEGRHDTVEDCEATRGPCLDPASHHPFQDAAAKPTGSADEPLLRAALEQGMAYAMARAPLPDKFETSRDYARRLAPLVLESGWLNSAALASAEPSGG